MPGDGGGVSAEAPRIAIGFVATMRLLSNYFNLLFLVQFMLLSMYVVGKVVFAEVMLAALAFSGDCYYDNSWRRAAAMVTSPPLRPEADTADCLLSCLAKYFTQTLCLLSTALQCHSSA